MNIDRVEFKVDPANRVVIATIRDIGYDAVKCFDYKFLPHAANNFSFFSSGNNQKFFMPCSLKAVAHCHPEDKFDAEIGKKIALNKLVEKYNNSLDKHLRNIYFAMNKCLDNMNIYLKKHKVI